MASASAGSEQQPDYPATLALALLAFHRKVGPIRKESQAKYGAFADLHTVLEAITPPLLDQGLVLSQSLSEAAGGGSILCTELTHAPTGDKIASSCAIPSLQSLLDRVHQLRGDVLNRFPLDLQLAAIGALPPLLPSRPSDPATAAAAMAAAATGAAPAELPPPPQRPAGLRLDDQLKGLYTLLGQLGTTTNPLHALGGTITYLRRYQILSLLSLAPADDDGHGQAAAPGAASIQSDPRSAPHPPAPAAPPSRARTRRSSTSSAPRPQPTPAPQPDLHQPAAMQRAAQQAEPQQDGPLPAVQAAQPVPAAAAAPQPQPQPQSQPEQQPQPEDSSGAEQLLTPAEVQQLIGLIRTLPTEAIPHLVTAFRQQFQLPSSALVSDYIRTFAHAAFIREQVAAQSPAAL